VRANKRSKVDIYSSVLDCLLCEYARSGKASPTRVARQANLPYVRFQKILVELTAAGLVSKTEEDGLLLTEKGRKCLAEIRKANEVLRRMGLMI
jgi:predicted transcriptional regulator